MLEIEYTDEFEQRYGELPVAIQKKAEKQERLSRENPFYPSLRTEKLVPKSREYWSFRIDRQYRVIFRFLDKNRVLLLTVGPHHWIYQFVNR